MLNNPKAGSYLKLDGKDYYTWSLMDGSRSVKDLVVAYFSEFGSISYNRVTNLITQLRAASFLTDPPVDVYGEVIQQSRKGSPSYWAEKMWRAFLQKEIAISGVDGILTFLYRYVFWVLFSKPAFLLYPIMAIAGLSFFAYAVQTDQYPFLRTEGNVVLGLITYLVANFVVIAAREFAHVFATKHYGRKVRRGGLLIYFGSPAFFVDTMDIWMEPKRARMAVSAAGPYSGLLVGSVCMFIIAASGFSDAGLNSLLFKAAVWAFVFGALTPLNPLLEWDGYFMLMDWLEIPNLRKRSMSFVRRKPIEQDRYSCLL